MNSFYKLIASIIKEAEPFSGHSSFRSADPTAVGENPVREYKLDAVPLDGNSVMVTLSQDGGEKTFEKTMSSEEAKHTFELISSDMAEAVSLTGEQRYDEAKKVMENVLKNYSETTDTPIPTNTPKLHTTQAEKEESNLLKISKVVMQNLFFSTTEEAIDFQKKMKELQGPKDQDHIPLWDKVNQEEAPAASEKDTLSPPSISYEEQEKNKAKETKNLDKRIQETVKTELESALEEKKATMFTENDTKLIDGMRAVGRNWDEIKKYMVKELAYDKESVDMYIDDLRSKEEGIPVEEPKPLTPPENLVSPETHEKLLKDLEDKKAPPIEEVKEEKVIEEPIKEESSKKCPKCGEDIWDVAGGGMTGAKLNKCWNCGLAFDNPEKESKLDNEIARADNSEIRKVATVIPESIKRNVEEAVNSIYKMNAPGAKWYRFSIEGNKIYRGDYHWDDEFGPYQFMYNMETGEYKENPAYKPTAFASLSKVASYMAISEENEAPIEKVALNPLQEPIETEPTLPQQDVVPMDSQTHPELQKGDRVFWTSDLPTEKAGSEGTYISPFESNGDKYSVIEKDNGELVEVESHRVVKISEKPAQVTEPVMEPAIEMQKEPDIQVTPKMEDLHSSQDSFLTIKAEIETLSKELDGMGKISFLFVKKGLEKHANDSAYESNGWTRVWVDESEIEVDAKYPEILKLPDENARIQALKEVARDIAEETLHIKTSAGGDIAQMWFEGLTPSDRHDRIDWVKLANPEPEEVESSLETKANTMDTKCEECGEPLGPEAFLSKWPVCGKCTKRRHKKVTGANDIKCPECGTSSNVVVKDSPIEDSLYGCPKCKFRFSGYDVKKQAAELVPAQTEYKELKKAPDYVDPKSAIPASPDMEQVLVKMQSLQSRLATLDEAKEGIRAKMIAELTQIDVAGERAQAEKELQDSYEKLGILIDATESKVINWSDQLYTLQHQEKEVVPQPTIKELLAKIYAKFDGAEKYVESVLNGFKSLAKKLETKRLVKWPKRSSLEPVEKEASVIDDLNKINEEMLQALNVLSEPV